MSRGITSIILIAVGLLAYYFFFLPQLDALQAARFESETAGSAIQELTDLEAKRDQLTDTYNNVKASLLQKIDQVMPTGPSASALLSDLDAIARKDGVILKSVDFGEVTALSKTTAAAKKAPAAQQIAVQQQGVQVLPFKLAVVGRYDAFRRFLSDLELNQRLIDVTAVNFGSSVGEVYQFDVQAKTYYQY